MTAEAASRVAEFARACKAAIRIVSMYPPSHPTIQAALARMVAAGRAATDSGPMVLTVTPETLLLGGQSMPRPETAVDELAVLLHEHKVGELTVKESLTGGAWHALLSLLALPPADTASTPPAPVGGGAGVRVDIAGFSFGEPRTAAPGAVVEVANADAAAHTLTASGGAFDSGVVEQGAVGSFVAPAEPGTYDFYCEIHPSMTGSLVVG